MDPKVARYRLGPSITQTASGFEVFQILGYVWGYGRNRERSILETLTNRVSGRRDALRRKRHGGESLSLPFREISFLLGAQLYQEEFDKGNNLLIQKDLKTLRYNKCEETWFCFCISLLTPASLALLFLYCYCVSHSCTKPFYIRPLWEKRIIDILSEEGKVNI